MSNIIYQMYDYCNDNEVSAGYKDLVPEGMDSLEIKHAQLYHTFVDLYNRTGEQVEVNRLKGDFTDCLGELIYEANNLIYKHFRAEGYNHGKASMHAKEVLVQMMVAKTVKGDK